MGSKVDRQFGRSLFESTASALEVLGRGIRVLVNGRQQAEYDQLIVEKQ